MFKNLRIALRTSIIMTLLLMCSFFMIWKVMNDKTSLMVNEMITNQMTDAVKTRTDIIDNLIGVMKDTDLIVSRAGASTIAEVTAIGLPAIFVPSPYVAHNHQYMNAKELEEGSACKILLEEDFSKENLIKMIDEILNNKELYDKMHSESKKFGIDDSATKIYEEIRKLL